MNRVDKLIRDIEKLSLTERGEFFTRLRLPLSTINKVGNESSCNKQDEIGRDDSVKPGQVSPELLNSRQENFATNPSQKNSALPYAGPNDLEIMTEFMLHHTHPEWFDSPEKAAQGQHHFITELLYDNVIDVRVEYDRARLIKILEDVILVSDYLPNHTGDPAMITTKTRFERAEAHDRLTSETFLHWLETAEPEGFEPLDSAADRLRQYLRRVEGWEDYYAKIKEMAVAAEAAFCSAITYKLSTTFYRYFKEIRATIRTEDGIVSAAEYEELERDPLQFVRPRGVGGARRTKHNWIDSERAELASHYEKLLTRIKEAKKWYRENRDDSDWQKLIRVKYPEFSDSLIRRLCHQHRDPYRWTPSDIAIEYAARLCNLQKYTYKPFSYTPRQLKQKLPKAKAESNETVKA